jgi:uncharacterized membrane protein YgdD (TMEM256/DUF423 family)
MKDRARIIKLVSFLMLVAVVFGAMGAHWLKMKITQQQLESFQTGIEYQIYHSIAILLISFIPYNILNSNKIVLVTWIFILGIVLFSGSIYLLAIRDLIGLGKLVSFLGPITPIGGLFFISGWIYLFFSVKSNVSS